MFWGFRSQSGLTESSRWCGHGRGHLYIAVGGLCRFENEL